MFDYDVFLSFSSDDEKLVRTLWQRMCLSGLRVFWSDATLKQKLGESWFDSIQSALERSRHFVLVASATSMTSEWVRREYKAFYSHCYEAGVRRLIPVVTDTLHISKLPLLLKDLEASHLSDPESIKAIIRLVGGEDVSALRMRLTELESDNSLLRREIIQLKKAVVDSQHSVASSRAETAPATSAPATVGTIDVATEDVVAHELREPLVELVSRASSAEQMTSLPPSDADTTAAVEEAIKDMVVQGGMGLSHTNSVAVWRRLNRDLAGREIPELCRILEKGHSWDFTIKALLLLNYSAVRPQAAVWQSLILASIENHIVAGGHVQDVALRLIPRLRVERRDVWRCLFDALQMAQDSRAAHALANAIAGVTPSEEKNSTGAALLDLLFCFDDSTYDNEIAKAIGALNYRTAIPALREVFPRYAMQKVHYKITSATDLLVEWRDKDATPYMRSYIDAMYRAAISGTYCNVMKGLYKLEGSSCASYIADRILNSSTANQAMMYYWTWEDYRHEPEIMRAVRLLGEKSDNAELRTKVDTFLASVTK